MDDPNSSDHDKEMEVDDENDDLDSSNHDEEMENVEIDYDSLSFKEAKEMLKSKGLPIKGSRAVLIERLKEHANSPIKEEGEEEYTKLNFKEAKELLKEIGLPLKGNRNQLIQRLKDFKSGKIKVEKKAPPKGKKGKKENEEIDPEEYVRYVSVIITGAREGEYLAGTKTQSLGAIIRIAEGTVPPDKDILDAIRKIPNLWKRFVDKLGGISFFGEMSNAEREEWLAENEYSGDIYIDEVENVMIEVVDMGSSSLVSLSEANMSKLTNDGPLPGPEIHAMFPGKVGSQGLKGRVTLMFRRSIWIVTSYDNVLNEYEGLMFDTQTGQIYNENLNVGDEGVIHLMESLGPNKTDNIGIISWKTDESLVDMTLEVIEDFFDFSEKDLKIIETGLSKFTPAGLKSVLQKIIRFRPKFIRFGSIVKNTEISGELVLLVALRKLMLSPGSFVPDIQRFVTGMESAFKRLIVTLCEDAIISEDNINIALGIMACAFLSQRLKNWKPSREIIKNMYTLALAGIDSDAPFTFDIKRGMKQTPYSFESSSEPMEYISCFLDEMRSFSSDLGMVRDIALHYPAIGEENKDRPEVMVIEHSIDQHWAPEIVYFYESDIIHETKRPGSKPFGNLMWNIFSEVTGVNPRRQGRKRQIAPDIHSYDDKFEDRPFVKSTRVAQKLLLKAKQKRYIPKREALDGKFIHTYTLDRSWLAGLLGAININIGISLIVTLNPNELEEFVVIKKPTRDMKDSNVSDDIKERAIENVKLMLRHGINMKNPAFGGKKIYLKDDGYYIDDELWDQFRVDRTEEIPYIDDLPEFESHYEELNIALDHSLLTEGIVVNPQEQVNEILERSDPMEVRRLVTYLSGSEIRVNPLSRDGGGSKYSVVIEDAGAFQLLLKLSAICPGIIHRKPHTIYFVVKSQPLLEILKDWVMDYINSIPFELTIGSSEEEKEEWPVLEDHSKRELWDHQIHAIDEMKEAHLRGRRGHFIWATVGSGKTLITLSYLAELQSMGNLPPYIMYTLPPEALKSIKEELELFGLTVELLIPLKSIPKVLVPLKKKTETKKKKIGTKMKSKRSTSPTSDLSTIEDDEDYEKVYKDFKKIFTINHGTTPNKYVVTLVLHDHLRLIQELATLMPQTIFIVDEVHKALSETLRTDAALNFSGLAQEFIALTGTPIIDNKIYRLIWWLKRVVPFEVNENSFWVAVNAMVSKIVNTGVKVQRDEIPIDMNAEELAEYRKLVPLGLGGINKNAGPKEFSRAMNICYEACTREMVAAAIENEDFGVFMVARNQEHQQRMYEMLKEGGIDENDIFLIEKGSSIVLNDRLVEAGEVHDYKFVITTISRSAGYTLSRLKLMITCVYPSNNAVRTQLDGRINRLDQSAETIFYFVYHTGILTNILERHNDARSLEMAIKAIAEEVDHQMD
jgi:hypothetical protein